ncbi:MAG: DEAD/DEAH box helicase [Atopostipes sp.]|nr:DEAD/DEAH box helicase [Atopostipes sp.]
MESILYGRELLEKELPAEVKEGIKKGMIHSQSRPAFFKEKGRIFCQRCQAEMTLTKENECLCREDCAYCRYCLKMGKVRKCSFFYSLKEPNDFKKQKGKLLTWEGELSKEQQLASKDLMTSIQKKETRLLWAVAGAGKTEILFAGLEEALKRGERVCLASPRVDVCLELAPRIAEAFPSIPISLLYGGVEEAYSYQQLTIATTHQLFRFQEAFDLLIIDEIDAFPFAGDESLERAVGKARKENSALIYLSATPNRRMQKEIKNGKLGATILPARYHGHPLPLPQMKWCANWTEKVFTHFERSSLGKIMAGKIQEGRRFLLFLPNIKWMLTFEEMLRKIYPECYFESVSSMDPHRKEKVLKMRAGEVQFLMTTTILERGVTFPNIDVLVLGAEDRIYTESALVQIAGRCGRAADYPDGEVIFFHEGKSLAMKRAVQQIKRMNHLARKRGLIQ